MALHIVARMTIFTLRDSFGWHCASKILGDNDLSRQNLAIAAQKALE